MAVASTQFVKHGYLHSSDTQGIDHLARSFSPSDDEFSKTLGIQAARYLSEDAIR